MREEEERRRGRENPRERSCCPGLEQKAPHHNSSEALCRAAPPRFKAHHSHGSGMSGFQLDPIGEVHGHCRLMLPSAIGTP